VRLEELNESLQRGSLFVLHFGTTNKWRTVEADGREVDWHGRYFDTEL